MEHIYPLVEQHQNTIGTGPVVCDGKLECDRGNNRKFNYSTTPSYHYLHKNYPSYTPTYNYPLYKDKYGNNIDFSIIIGEEYKSWSYVSQPGQTSHYTGLI